MINNNLRIKKVFFKNNKGVVKPYRKVVLEKIEEDAYLVKDYRWSGIEKAWYPSHTSAFFNGEELIETGVVRTRANKDIDRYFELCVKYEEFMYMEQNENNKDTGYELDVIQRSELNTEEKQ